MTGKDEKEHTWHPQLSSDQQQKTDLKTNEGQLFRENKL